MTDHSNIDEQFRQNQGDWEANPSNAAWENLSDRLDGFNAVRKRRKKTIFRLAVAASLTILLGLSFAMFNQSMDVAGFHAVNANQEIPIHEDIYDPATTDRETAPAMTSRHHPAEESYTDQGKERTSNTAAVPPASVRSYATEKSAQEDMAKAARQQPQENALEALNESYEEAEDAIMAAETELAYKVTNGDEIGRQDKTSSGASYSEEMDAPEPEGLTETAVANAIGTEQRKADHKKQSKAKSAGRAFTAPSSTYEATGDRAEDFVGTSLIVLIPNENKGRCTYTALLVEEEQFYIDRCQTDAFDLLTTESLPLDRSILEELLHADVERMLQIEKENRSEACAGDQSDIQLVYRYGTSLSHYDETIAWSSDSECLTPEASDIVLRLRELLQSLK